MNGHLSPSGAASIIDLATGDSTPGRSQLTIILADNDPTSRRALAQSLSKFHCRVLEYPTGVEALEAAACEEPDAIILSTRLPDTDGMNALADLRSTSETACLPVILLATAALEEERAEYLAAGAAGFFTKPAQATEIHWAILRALQNALNEASPGEEAELPDAASF